MLCLLTWPITWASPVTDEVKTSSEAKVTTTMSMQKTGTEAGLKDGPRTMNHDRHSNGTRQDFGTSAPLKSNPSSNKFSTGGGSMELTGTKSDLSSSPSKGYTSANTPMSKRSIAQSK